MPPKQEELEILLEQAEEEMRDLAADVDETNRLGHFSRTDSSKLPLFKARLSRIDSTHDRFCKSLSDAKRYARKLDKIDNINQYDELKNSVRTWYYEALSMDFAAETSLDRSTIVHQPKISLPKINLPSFNGDISQWVSFKDTYVSLIHSNADLTAVQKFHYLKSSLRAQALQTIASIPVSESNYNQAWEVLIKRFDNKRIQATHHLMKIFNFKPLQKYSLASLEQFSSVVLENSIAYRNLNIEDASGFALLTFALRLLDTKTRERFEHDHLSDTKIPTFQDFHDFIHLQCVQLQSSVMTSSQGTMSYNAPFKNDRGVKQVLMTVDKGGDSIVCFICKGNHRVYDCSRFRSWEPKQRYEQIKLLRRCFNCLSAGHSLTQCPSKNSCRQCYQRHHSMLHFNSNKTPANDGQKTSTNRPKPSTSAEAATTGNRQGNKTPGTNNDLPGVQFLSSNENIMHAAAVSESKKILLGTAQARIRDHSGFYHDVRLVIDSGSQRSFITTECAKKLGLPLCRNPHRLCGFGNTAIPGGKHQIKCILRPKTTDQPQLETEAIVMDRISNNMPLCSLPEQFNSLFVGHHLADPSFSVSQPVEFLLGADLFSQILTGSVVHTPSGYPDGISTIFGLVIIGPISAQHPTFPNVALSMEIEEPQPDIDHLLKKFWEVDEVPVVQHKDPLELKCENHFIRTHSRVENGRFTVRLPFKEETVELGESRHVANYRFQRLEMKLNKKTDLKQSYSQTIKNYQTLNYIGNATVPGKYFLPHHGVMKNSPDAKLRIVFDASAKTSHGSLNDKLLTGPKLQTDIRDVLLNFRLYRYVFTADIQEMYLQIIIHPEDRCYLHFLYRFNHSDALQEYEFQRLPFGLSSSPFLAIRVIQQLVKEDGANFPLASKALVDNIYIDDILTGDDSLQQACQLQQELTSLLKKGGFNLKKWASNSSTLLDGVPHEDSQAPVSLPHFEQASIKLLGMQWDPNQDYLSYNVQLPSHVSCTKRGIMSVIARIYDPLGYLAPVVFRAKSLLQRLWKLKLDWDDILPQELVSEWKSFLFELPQLQAIKIPRHIFPNGKDRVLVIGFADASTLGYAAAIYIRSENSIGQCDGKLLLAKTRVAPTKLITLPRLELCAAVLLIKTIRSLQHFLDPLNCKDLYLISDSSIVLSWLRIDPHKLKTFVANRVAFIRGYSELHHWYHISSAKNMADVASRGLEPSLLVHKHEWWKGPEWLLKPTEQWPISSRFNLPPTREIPELRETSILTAVVETAPLLVQLSERFSSYNKLLRVVSYVQRYLNNSRLAPDERRHGCITWSEMWKTRLVLLRSVQQYYFKDDMPLEKSKKLKSLSPFVDEQGLIRVGGRLQNSNLNYNSKHPVLLPSNAHFTRLIVEHLHRSYLHAGPRLLQSAIKQLFWILSATKIIKATLRNCTVCYRRDAKNFSPLMGNLPPSRFEQGRAFLNTGIDFAGPFLIKDSPRRKYSVSKSYVCLFICFSTKAIHLEVVSSMTTEAFLAALDRFIARRGLPSKIFTDNGRNFLGAYHHFKELRAWWNHKETQRSIETHLTAREIQWNFIPPFAPHFGGLWEAGVKSFKYHLDRVLSSQPLTIEEFTTVTARIEAVLNSRPLYALSSEPEDFDVLTPGHFLIGAPLLAAPEYNFTDTKTNRLSRWQFLQQCCQQIWKRWRLDYLHELQQRNKWTSKSSQVQEGTLVLLREPNVPPLEWPTGRISKIYPGKDGVVRVVELTTPKGRYLRSVSRLAPLLNPDCPATNE